MVEVMSRGESMTFAPSKEVLKKVFEEVVSKCVQRICSKHRELIVMNEIQPYIQEENNVVVEAVDLKGLVMSNEVFMSMQQ